MMAAGDGDSGSGQMTVHYFDLYGRAEPIRMALWKAGVDYKENKVA